jgi:eukaryotic-like serine/threonine-protein kinase
MRAARPLTGLFAATAMLKIFLGLVAAVFVVTSAIGPVITSRYLLMLAHVAAFAAAGLVLVIGGRSDPRATLLGVVFLLVSSVFADQLITPLRTSAPAVSLPLRGLFAIQVDAFTPCFLWLFVRDFPRIPEDGAIRRRLNFAIRISLVVGVVLVAANIVSFLDSLSPAFSAWRPVLRLLSRHGNTGVYWPLQFALSIVALPTLAWKARRAPIDERRRAFLLVGALVAGTAPTVVWVFLQAISPTVAAVLPLRRVGWVLYPTLLSTPFTTAYAVVVRRALNITLVIRQAVQYALARYSVIIAATVPIVLLALSVYSKRDASVAQLLSNPSELLLAGLAVVGLVTLRRRSEVLDWIDRRFFREQYDSRWILGQLVDRCRTARDPRELAEIIRTEVDRALHLESASVLFLDSSANAFVSPNGDVRPLDAGAPLAEVVGRGIHTVDLDLEHPSPLSRGLPAEDLNWLVDGGFRLLLPLRDPDRRVFGILALGEKKSELPFSREDRSLLSAVAAAAEMTAAFRGIARGHPKESEHVMAPPAVERCAAECRACGAVYPSDTLTCQRCGAQMVECILPETVAGKFRIDERIGAGGMGVVYRGVDVHLGRPVAIKTLPFLAPEEAVRLRREARAMASVSHPNLALIFGAETWQGRPMLVFEYLAGGTLADRLADGPLTPAEVVDLGIALSAVLVAIHRASVLHRDIKPSNIGFTADGIPKLLDFGLARILTALGTGEMSIAHQDHGPTSAMDVIPEHDLASILTSTSVVRGTLLYMSPEALLGDVPDPSFDTWSLCVVLYEAITGRNPLVGLGARGSLALLNGFAFPDIRTAVPAPVNDLADFFRRALSAEPTHRPRTAAELHDQLWQLRLGSVARVET